MQSKGALIKAVKPGSRRNWPAFVRAILVLEFDGLSIDNDGHLVQTVGLTSIGKPISMVIVRDGKRYQVQVQLTEQPTVY